ncbi:bifunctional NUDIX hydrolase/phosphatase PAP2 family protein [Photobacterium alginatilyticum]|uniref:bifunctional NUDIX hydrolase/phosphatase PAP2 family protein n=1 Tax=Photobacterium alginatilyticum TaxID=1775171 RepID=UPI004068D4C6
MFALLRIVNRLCFGLFLVCVALPTAATASVANESDALGAMPADIVGAVCVIRHDNKMVMLTEVITKKMSLPGGYIDKGDTPKQAAAREALEETGIRVKVGDLLEYRRRAAIFGCVAESPILVSSFQDNTGYSMVASWFAKHYATEVKRVYLVDPYLVEPEKHRFKISASLLAEWMEKTPSSEIEMYSDLSRKVNSLHRLELDWVEQLQLWVKSWPDVSQRVFSHIIAVVNLPGEPWFLALLAIVAIGLYGPTGLLQLAVVLLLATFTSGVIKLGLASPRPSDIMPELQQINAYGFGFPSGHTLMATMLWGMCWYASSKRVGTVVKWLLLPLFLILIVGQAIARVWYGVHFVSDTLASILLGVIFVSALIVWHSASSYSLQQAIVNRWFWLSMSFVVGIVAGLSQAPLHTYIFALLLGIVLSVEALPDKPFSLSFLGRFKLMLIMLTGVGVIGAGIEFLATLSSVSLIVLAVRGAGWTLAAIWLIAGSSALTKRLK